MISLMNPPGIKTLSGLHTQSLNLPLGHAVRSVTTGTEGPRYATWFVDRFYTRRRWRKLAETAHR